MLSSSEHLWYLVSLKLSGEAGPEQLAELDELLKANPEAVFQVEVMEQLWRQRRQVPPQQVSEAYSRHLQRLSNHLSEPVLKYADSAPAAEPAAEAPVRTVRRWWQWASVAPTVLVGVLLYLFRGAETKTDNPPSQNVVSTKPGSKSKVQLPDGTVVWLNSGSRLTYNESADGRLREAQLSGEAYFEVAKDKKRPFIIHTGTIDVKVLGTAFNLRAYPDEKTTETALIHGSVEIKLLDKPDQKFILKPNEKLVVQNKKVEDATTAAVVPLITHSRLHKLEHDSSIAETSWSNNKLAFDEERLDEIARKLERWYGVQVIITDEALKEEATYSSTFEGEGLEEVLKALQFTGKFKYSISNKEVRISR